MEPQKSRIELKVGVFVLVGLIGAMVSILLLGGDRFIFQKQILLHARFSEVQGLFRGSVVSLSGLKIGNIRDIKMGDDFKLDVEMAINANYANRITEGSIVEIKTQGALGDRFLYIKPGSPEAKPVQDGALLPSDETDFFKLLTSRDDGIGRAMDLIKELHILVAGINQEGKSLKMMGNLTDASEKLKSVLGKLDNLLSDVNGPNPEDKRMQKAIVSLNRILEKIDKGQGTLGQLINDPSVHQSIKNLLGPSPRGKFMKDMVRETIKSVD